MILAGGRGVRLRPITDEMPKPMALVNGAPFLDYLINSAITAGLTDILLLLGYKGHLIRQRYEKLKNVNIEFHQGADDDETGRRLLNAYHLLDDDFLLMYGDNYWPIEMNQLAIHLQNHIGLASTTVFSNHNGTGEYGYQNNIAVNHDKLVIRYDKTRKSRSLTGVDIGYFVLPKHLLDSSITANVSFEKDILPLLIAGKKLTAYVTNTQYYYITDIRSLDNFEKAIRLEGFHPVLPECFE